MRNNTTRHHLLHQISPLIEKHKVMMVDYTSCMIANNVEYISPYTVIALCHQGYAVSEYDMKPAEFHAHDIAVMHSGHLIKNITTSSDYSAQLIVCSSSFMNFMKQKYLSHQLTTQKSFEVQPCLRLNNEQYRQVCDVFNLMRTVCSIEGNYREELISNVNHTLVVLLCAFRDKLNDSQQEAYRQLSPQFSNAVIKHYRQSREVSFYARMFNLSPKYFSTIIKQETGILASEWIDRYVVLQAKSLLIQQRKLTIQQVAYQMGFHEQTSFSRFFKCKTGLSPTEYRRVRDADSLIPIEVKINDGATASLN